MRADAIGLFWEDKAAGRRKGEREERPMPPIPESPWRPPESFPDLRGAKILALDVETWDPELKTHGPGWARGKGHLVGMSVSVGPNYSWYFPMRHETCKEQNLDPEQVLRWARDQFDTPHQTKVGANITYDVGWLRQEGVKVSGPLFDIQFAEALLDEAAEVNLEAVAFKYLGQGKVTSVLYQWLSEWFGGAPTGDQRKHIHRAPPSLVGPYAEADAYLPIQLAPILWQKMNAEGLLPVFDMESRLIRLMLDMRFAGVRVDTEKASLLRDRLIVKEQELDGQLAGLTGHSINCNKSADLALAFDAFNIPYPRTAKNAPSFTKMFLEGVDHPLGKLVVERRKIEKLRSTFVESYVLNSHVNGMVYGQFHQLRGDDDGTRSGRFSSSGPNLQNLPSRDDELAPLVRGLFVPDYGHKQWRKYDYSQIEYRFLAHFAVGPKADEVRAVFNNDPHADYHQITIDLIKSQTGHELDRKPAKTINFGLIYGMGQNKLGNSLHLSQKETKALFKAYHEGAPFAKATMDATSEEARTTGVVRTYLGRKSRFDLWEPDQWGREENTPALPYREALLRYGSIRRAYLHKALNRKLQGSAADMMKMAMDKCYTDGVFDYIGVPRLTVHDELDFSDPGGKDDGFDYMRNVLENVAPLRIPVKCDCDIGPDWGHVEEA